MFLSLSPTSSLSHTSAVFDRVLTSAWEGCVTQVFPHGSGNHVEVESHAGAFDIVAADEIQTLEPDAPCCRRGECGCGPQGCSVGDGRGRTPSPPCAAPQRSGCSSTIGRSCPTLAVPT